MKRTLKRELKAPKIDMGEAHAGRFDFWGKIAIVGFVPLEAFFFQRAADLWVGKNDGHSANVFCTSVLVRGGFGRHFLTWRYREKQSNLLGGCLKPLHFLHGT